MNLDKLVEEYSDYSYDIKNDDFSKANEIFDWRRFVPEELQEEWTNLSDRERKIVFCMAVDHAIHVDWED